jgi:hypothetical protein
LKKALYFYLVLGSFRVIKHGDKKMKTLLTAILTLLGCAILHAQDLAEVPALSVPQPKHLTYAEEAVLSQRYWRDTAVVAAVPETNITGNLSPIYAWAREIVTVAFSGKDVVSKEKASHASVALNHDGKAFDGHIWTTHGAYDDNVVNYAQNRANVALYEKNIKSGVWKKFVNGE